MGRGVPPSRGRRWNAVPTGFCNCLLLIKEPEQPKPTPKPVAPEPVKPQPVPGLKIIDVEEVQALQYKGAELESLKFTFPAPKIGNSAFEGCKKLKTVAFPAKVS